MYSQLLKNIIREIFPSADMQEYLCVHTDDLTKWQVVKMVSKALIPLQRKLEIFQELMEYEDLRTELRETQEVQDGTEWEDICEKSFKYRVEVFRKALTTLECAGKEHGVFLYLKYGIRDGKQTITECLPFYSYEKINRHLQEELADVDENAVEERQFWYEIQLYKENSAGDLDEYYTYAMIDGKVTYFLGSREDNTWNIYPDLWADGELSLPVPFLPGDIVQIDGRPFSEKRRVLILEIGDNWDCCCVQALYVREDGKLETGALKHGGIFWEIRRGVTISPLYRATRYCGELCG